MRKIVAALQVSLDGLIEGPNGELDWVADWGDNFDLTSEIDGCILGGGMYGGYEQYWTSILADSSGVLAFTGRPPTKAEIAYAAFADRTPHFVLSTSLDKTGWHVATIVRDVEGIRALKHRPGGVMHAVGGAGLVSTLMNHGLVDELRLIVNPIVLGRGKALFKDVQARHPLALTSSEAIGAGQVRLTYAALS